MVLTGFRRYPAPFNLKGLFINTFFLEAKLDS